MAPASPSPSSLATSPRPLQPLVRIETNPVTSSERFSSHRVNSPIGKAPVASSSHSTDPEGFLKRCCGYNKKTRLRCCAQFGQSRTTKNTKNTRTARLTYLPTCHAHRDQLNFAGYCQFVDENGARCRKLFRWSPPYLQLCAEHKDYPNNPCYFMKIPVELRFEIFQYLLPSRPIGSSTSILHQLNDEVSNHEHHSHLVDIQTIDPNFRPHLYRRCGVSWGHSCTFRSAFQMPLLDIFLVSRQIYLEVKDFLFSTVPFTIDIRKDGAFMCGRRILEPRRADGSSHYVNEEALNASKQFIERFDFQAVKIYNVDILVENGLAGDTYSDPTMWDEEVELYDIRDYVSVVVSGVLSKSKNLCRLNVRLGLSDFSWSEEEVLANTKILLGPFERLRNVRQPRLCGVFRDKPEHNYMMRISRPKETAKSSPIGISRTPTPLCSVPSLAAKKPIFQPGVPIFDTYSNHWEGKSKQVAECSIIPKPPISLMFLQIKCFYASLVPLIPEVTRPRGRNSYLHIARVARETENVIAIRELRKRLVDIWKEYNSHMTHMRNDISMALYEMLVTDPYPAHEEEEKNDQGLPAPESDAELPESNPQSPNPNTWSSELPDTDAMAAEGIPMQVNGTNTTARKSNQDNADRRLCRQSQFLDNANKGHINRMSVAQQMQALKFFDDTNRGHTNRMSVAQQIQALQLLDDTNRRHITGMAAAQQMREQVLVHSRKLSQLSNVPAQPSLPSTVAGYVDHYSPSALQPASTLQETTSPPSTVHFSPSLPRNAPAHSAAINPPSSNPFSPSVARSAPRRQDHINHPSTDRYSLSYPPPPSARQGNISPPSANPFSPSLPPPPPAPGRQDNINSNTDQEAPHMIWPVWNPSVAYSQDDSRNDMSAAFPPPPRTNGSQDLHYGHWPGANITYSNKMLPSMNNTM